MKVCLIQSKDMATVPHQFEKGHERIFMLNRKIECTSGKLKSVKVKEIFKFYKGKTYIQRN